MPQISSWTIANSGGSTYRAAVNTALAAIQSSSSGTAAPSPTVAGMLWYDTTNSILKRRNTANTAWIDVSFDTLPASVIRGNSSGSAAVEGNITMPTLRTMLGFPVTSASVGQWVRLQATTSTALSLPAGGTWAYFAMTVNGSTGVVNNFAASVAAGGTLIFSAVTGFNHNGFAWRIA